MRCFICLLFACLIAPAACASPDSPYPGAPPGFEEHPTFTSGTDGYLFYRIPSAVVTRKGTVLAICEGRRTPWGPLNDGGEINVLVKRSTDGGKTFGAQQVIWADGKNTCGNPTAIVDRDTGTVVLLMCHNVAEQAGDTAGRKAEIRAGRTVWVTRSEDDGQSWSPPVDITKDVKKPEWGWYATGPGVGIQLERGEHRGRLVVSCNHTEAGESFSHAIYSDDHGKTWRLGGTEPVGEGNESQIVELTDGSLMLNMRNAKAKGGVMHHERAVAISHDGGATFSDFHRDPALLDPICQGSILRYSWPEGDAKGIILFANPASATERTTMTVRLSYDDGKTWPMGQLVNKGWSCYSSLVKLPGGDVGLVYEAGSRARYETINFVRMSMGWLTKAEDQTKLP